MSTHPLVLVLIYPFYLLCRLLFHLIRNIVWRLNGTRCRLQQNAASTSPRAHAMNIVMRYKYDTLLQSNKIEDFILTHSGFEDADYVLKDEVSLYTINQSECIFVECRSDKSVWDLDDFCYSREAQFNKAIRILVLPTLAVYKLTEEMTRPKRVVILGNTSRCGSTLLCRILQDTGHFICYTDPGAVSDLVPYVGLECNDTSKRHIYATLTLLCKPSKRDPNRGHVVKVMASASEVMVLLYQVFPEIQYMFLYRNHLSVLKSLARYTPSRPYEEMQRVLCKISRSLAKRHRKYHFNMNKLDMNNSKSGEESPYSSVIYKSIPPLVVYYNMFRAGVDIFAVRFEDIIQDPDSSLRRLYLLCDVPVTMVSRALRILDKDAQEKSPVTSREITKYKIPPFTEDDEKHVNAVCVWLGIPNALTHKVLPGTITMSGDDSD